MIGIGLVLLVAGLISLGVIHIGPRATALVGAIVTPPFEAPNFQLQDQFDQPIALNSFRGKAVVLTFLYTNCPDACPLITEKLHQAYGQLGPDASRTAILAVTVDPAHDTIAQVRSYSVQKDMLQKWHFLVGPAATVGPVWAAYGIEATPDSQLGSTSATAPAGGSATPVATAASGPIDHTAPIFVIDPSGKARVLLDVNFETSDLVQDVRAVLGE
jgi:protein SCO1/2